MAEEVKSTEGTESQETGAAQDKQTDLATVTTFTQADMDRVVKERLERERKKFADYGDLKKAAAKLKEIEDAQKSESDKLLEELEGLKEQNARLQQERIQMSIEQAVAAEAQRQKFARPELVYRLLDQDAIQVTEAGKIEGVESAVKALSEAYPELLETTPRMSPTNLARGGQSGETDAQRRARIFGGGTSPVGSGPGAGVFMPKQIE
jgi:hypothetical protein